MENPEELLATLLALVGDLPGVETVVLTGSRARDSRVDEYSDLDIELIGPGTAELIGREDWLAPLGEILVALHLANGGPGEPEYPTVLLVLAGGRKIDITLAPVRRLRDLIAHGLDDTYLRGYRILHDEGGHGAGLAPSRAGIPRRTPPTAAEFDRAQAEFWFEATQLPIYLARGDMWPVQLRDAEMKARLLEMFEWRALAADPGVDVWHDGHHLHEWLPATLYSDLWEAHAGFRAADALRALRVTVDLYAEVSAEVGAALGLPTRAALRPRVLRHIAAVAGR
ncbi:aminoglycoside 6-adenylyltransferase [Mycetocola spongiae]|uniref:aminoglycoside 6-adenylyltransferase n=1 Tax=Mycetocola spongiae TaxID=2859226 RepID=UPI001CF15418|nr:aminoglycoside 6-adenylyltransferase [Mycetocola spongiae]UCR89639.1 aminoglycoside 6-adenylyltransferase [Mycetocola spongiae]